MKLAVPALWERYYLTPKRVKNRRNPFEIEQAFTISSDVSIKLDRSVPGAMLEKLTTSNDGEICRWKVTATGGADPKSIRVKAEVVTTAGDFPAEKYATYERERHAALKALATRLDLGPPETISAP